MSAKPDTREEILKTASNMLQLRGFNGFSYGHIAEVLGVKAAAVHYHFPSKTDLGLALIARYRERYGRWMKDAQGLSARERLEGYITIYSRFLQEGAKACPAGVLQAEYQAIPEEMQRETRRMVQEIHRWLTDVLEDGRRKSEFAFNGDGSDKATVVMATLQGALQGARALGKECFQAAVRQLKKDLGV
ncbi:MAG: TetR/AcrR family transcriptional regulator [Myxococcota bacterium]